MVTRHALLAAAVLLGCQGNRGGTSAGTGSSSGARAEPRVDARAVTVDGAVAAPAALDGEAQAGSGSGTAAGSSGSGSAMADDPGAGSDKPVTDAIADLNAISAWQSVIDRAQYLSRRGQTGTIYGRIGPPILMERVPLGSPPDAPPEQVPSQYVWLVDDTEGNGTLGVRVALDGHAAKLGDRVALGGAWTLDEARTWFWQVESLRGLPPLPPVVPVAGTVKDAPAAIPNHVIVTGELPGGARTITVSRDNDAIYFMLVGPPPVRDGDGWLVANELGDAPFARLVLPGERPSYGGQDMRSTDERWDLRKGQTYWVRIGKIRPAPGPDKPVGMTARTAPVRVN